MYLFWRGMSRVGISVSAILILEASTKSLTERYSTNTFSQRSRRHRAHGGREEEACPISET
jgi:hypothetical protein